jgi:hypothetical protein
MRRLKDTSETVFAAERKLIAIFRREGLIR